MFCSILNDFHESTFFLKKEFLCLKSTVRYLENLLVDCMSNCLMLFLAQLLVYILNTVISNSFRCFKQSPRQQHHLPELL